MKQIEIACYPFSDKHFPIGFCIKPIASIRNTVQSNEGLELFFVLRGQLISEINGNPPHTSPDGGLVVTNHLDMFRLYSDDSETTLCVMTVGNQFMEDSGLIPEDVSILNYIKSLDVQERFRLLIREYQETPQLYLTEMKSQTISLLIHLMRHHAKTDVIPLDKVQCNKVQMVNSVLVSIQHGYTGNLTNQQIAQEHNFNLYYMCRTFKELTGRTIHNHINHLRCIHAMKLILCKEHTISEVMQAVGFNNASHFAKVYKSHIGCLPSQTADRVSNDEDLGARGEFRHGKIKAWTWRE